MKEYLTQKERLERAAGKAEVDRPPCICPGGMMNMVSHDSMKLSGCYWPQAHSQGQQMAQLALAMNEAGGFENYGVPFCMTVEAQAMGAKVNMGDEFCEPHVVNAPIESAAQWSKLSSLDVNSGRPAAVIEAIRILKEAGTGTPVIGNLTGPVSVAGTVVDMSTLLKEFRKDGLHANRLLSFIADNLIAFGQAQIRAGADAICISEPSGTGEILGPRFFEEYTIQYVNRVLDALTVPVKIVHICGNLKAVYPLLSKLHCDVFSFDAMVSIEEVKAAIPDKAVMGNINTHALGTMGEEKVRQLVLAAAGKGIDILAPACGLPVTTPLQNIRAMVDTACHLKEKDESQD